MILAGLISALGGYLVAARKMSGEVKNSDAEQLWAESRSIREWSSDRIAELNGTIGALEERVRVVEKYNEDLTHEKHDLIDTIEDLNKELADCRIACHEHTAQLRIAQERLRAKGDDPLGHE